MNQANLTPLLPHEAGSHNNEPCLCIGLDIAWFGGSAGKPDTQHDCLVSAVIRAATGTPQVRIHPVQLTHRDPQAEQIFAEIQNVIQAHGTIKRVVLAIDAPLQGTREIPAHRQRARRHCENQLSAGRMAIDQAASGAAGWHPIIQPGLPLAPRVQKLLSRLTQDLGMQLWTKASAQPERIVIECFPAEAIWAAKRLGGYRTHPLGAAVKSYKCQHGKTLSAAEVEDIVNRVLLDAFEEPSGLPNEWSGVVKELIQQMLIRSNWEANGSYRGGKLLDDVIDSALCLVVALSYAHGQAHVWHAPDHPTDGHIIGPGTPQALLTGVMGSRPAQ